jgi:hypothetical protein
MEILQLRCNAVARPLVNIPHLNSLSLSLMLRPTVSRPVCLGIKHPSLAYDQIYITVRHLRVFYVGRSMWRENGSVVYNCYWPSPAQSFSGPSPVGLVTIFYGHRFETSLFVASYDSQGYSGGIRPRLHMGDTQPAKIPRYTASGRTQQKTPPLTSLTCCYGRLPSNSSDIVEVFIGRYQATHVPFRDRCIATVLHIKIP